MAAVGNSNKVIHEGLQRLPIQSLWEEKRRLHSIFDRMHGERSKKSRQ